MVTVLMCDLVGFTAASEAVDPEDADRTLREYAAVSRRCVELYGGVVEKFIGDAVVAMFGIPSAHGDDAERAVLAGQRLIAEAYALPSLGGAVPQVRVGINTGFVVAHMDVDPRSGLGLVVGDAVNTAARLQAGAPPMSVVVGKSTHDLTADRFAYRAMAPTMAKGKALPLETWQVTSPVSRVAAELERRRTAPFIDRKTELGILEQSWADVLSSRCPRFILLEGEAGIGKSRLIEELARALDAAPEIVVWREGRCAPFGDSSAYSALAEMVRMHAGILETDSRAAVSSKLDATMPATCRSTWLRGRIGTLLGLEATEAGQDENFAAWGRLLAGMALEHPTVLVFEDIQWGGDGTVAFLRHLHSTVTDVPLLVLCTARPEFGEATPDFLRGREATTLTMSALPRRDAEALVSAMTRDDEGPLSGGIAERSGGNPLYAEELVRFIRERRRATDTPSRTDDLARPEDALPDSLYALVEARLDTLPGPERQILADAAVIGDRFWCGAVAAVGGLHSDTAGELLRELSSRQLVRPLPQSSLADEAEYAFHHAVTHDVAYARLPRAMRAVKHEATGRWLERVGGTAAGDFAAVVAHHYATAYDLATAAHEKSLSQRVRAPAVRALRAAGDHALPLDVPTAERFYARALGLSPTDGAERFSLLARWGRSLVESGRMAEAIAALRSAIDGLLESAAPAEAAAALTDLGTALQLTGDIDDAGRAHRDAIALLAADGLEHELIHALCAHASMSLVTADTATALEYSERALAVAERHGLQAPPAALWPRAEARCVAGDESGLEIFRLMLARAKDSRPGRETARIYFNFAEATAYSRGPVAALSLREEGLGFAMRRHDRAMIHSLTFGLATDLYLAGRWPEALARASAIDAQVEAAGSLQELAYLRSLEALLLTKLGRPDEALPLASWAVTTTRGTREPNVQTDALVAATATHLALGHDSQCGALLGELSGLPGAGQEHEIAWQLPEAARCAADVAESALAGRLEDLVEGSSLLARGARATVRAIRSAMAGDHRAACRQYALAAALWRRLGVPYELAWSRFGQGECLVALGRSQSGRSTLLTARATFVALGATTDARRVDSLVEGLPRRAD